MSTAPVLEDRVVALYVDPRGPYPQLVRHWYDADRNAMTYRGNLPVVAHPPCGPWSHLSHLHKRAEEIALAPHAVATVQRVGGVLEHPAGSKLWHACRLPKPYFVEPLSRFPYPHSGRDSHGGYTIEVNQCDFGHPARKRTWLYVVSHLFVDQLPVMPPKREPTHWCSGGGSGRGKTPPGIKVCSAQQRRRTPVAFASWLIEVARQAMWP